MARKPKGSYVRSTADWFFRSTCTVGGFYETTTPNGVFMDLYNNATDGSVLVVHQIFTNVDGDGIYSATQFQGHSANLMRNGRTVVTGLGAPWGQLYYDLNTNPTIVLPQNTPLSDDFFFYDNFGAGHEFYAPGPLMVLTPGYSMRINNMVGFPGGGSALAVTFYYTVMPDAT